MSSHQHASLIEMANRIALFFDALPDRAEARVGVAEHVKKFWEPRMRRQLREVYASEEAKDLHPLVVEAIDCGILKLDPAPAAAARR
jgi:formate dehydrogenase subunit delta